jgi:multiple sugar transport system permease protein
MMKSSPSSVAQSPYLLLIPVATLLCFIIVIPEIWALYLSFTNYSPGTPPTFVGLSNYSKIFRDPVFWEALINSMIFLISVICFEFLIGFGTALLLFQGFRFQKIWTSLLIAPYAISPVVACVLWKYLLDPSYGAVNYVLSLFGLQPVRWFGNTFTAFIPIIITDVWINSPFVQIIAYSALISIPKEILEASLVDGVSAWHRFRYIIIPLLRPALLVALVFRLIFAFREFGIPWMMTQGGPGHSTEILSIYLYQVGFRYFQFGKGSAVAWIILLITALLSVSLVKKMYRTIF